MFSKKIKMVFLMVLLSGITKVAMAGVESKAVINIRSKLYVNGKLVGAPRMVVKNGQMAVVGFKNDNDDEYKIELVANKE